MPSNPIPNLTQSELKQLVKLLEKYEKHLRAEQGLAARIIAEIIQWARWDMDT